MATGKEEHGWREARPALQATTSMSRSPYGFRKREHPPLSFDNTASQKQRNSPGIPFCVHPYAGFDPNRDEFRLALLADSFAGGGLYRHARQARNTRIASPYCSEAMNEADAFINAEASKAAFY